MWYPTFKTQLNFQKVYLRSNKKQTDCKHLFIFYNFYFRNVILLDRTLCRNHWRINLRKHFGFVDSPNNQISSKCQQSTCCKPSRHRSVILWALIWTKIWQLFEGHLWKCTAIFHKIHVATFLEMQRKQKLDKFMFVTLRSLISG